MNKMLVLQVGVLVSFSNISGMETVKSLLGMNRGYSCKYTPERKESISLRIVDSNEAGKGFWFSTEDKYHDLEKGIFSLRLDGSAITADGECAQALMETVVTRPSVKIETTLDNKKTKPIVWETKGLGVSGSERLAVKNYAHRLNNALKLANKDVRELSIASGEGALADEHIRAVLEVPYSFNPIGSFNIKIPVNGRTKNKEINFPINQADVKNLGLLALAIGKATPTHNNIKVNYIEQGQQNSDRVAFLDKKTVEEQLKSYSFERLWRNRLLGFSVAGILVWLAYFKFNQK